LAMRSQLPFSHYIAFANQASSHLRGFPLTQIQIAHQPLSVEHALMTTCYMPEETANLERRYARDLIQSSDLHSHRSSLKLRMQLLSQSPADPAGLSVQN
jgi:hypothetical protein